MEAALLPIRLPPSHLPILQQVALLVSGHGTPAWVVGGYLRDLLLGRPSHDIDITVDGPAVALARELADGSGGSFVLLDAVTESARVVWKTEPNSTDGMLAVDLVRLRAPTIEDDLRLRDFTLNAIALPLELIFADEIQGDALQDPTAGVRDLRDGVVHACSARSFVDDPLRALRAVRIAAQLGLRIEDETISRMREVGGAIDSVARERVRDELLRLLVAQSAVPWLVLLDDVGLLTRIIPELEPARGCIQPPQHFLPVLDHLFETVRAWEWIFGQLAHQPDGALPAAARQHPGLTARLSSGEAHTRRMLEPLMAEHPRYAFFKLAALVHDIGKPTTRQVRSNGRITFYQHEDVGAEIVGKVAQRLRLGRDAAAYVQLIVREHMRPGQLRSLGPDLTRRAIYRLLRDTGPAAPDVLLHSLCDHMAARGPHLSPDDWAHHLAWTEAILGEEWAAHDRQRGPRLITGQDIVGELGVPPGPLVGRVLAAVEEAYYLGEVQDRVDALDLAAQILKAEQRSSKATSGEK